MHVFPSITKPLMPGKFAGLIGQLTCTTQFDCAQDSVKYCQGVKGCCQKLENQHLSWPASTSKELCWQLNFIPNVGYMSSIHMSPASAGTAYAYITIQVGGPFRLSDTLEVLVVAVAYCTSLICRC